MRRILFITLLVVSSVARAQNGNLLWKSNTASSKARTAASSNFPQKNLYDLDLDALHEILMTSPKRMFNNQQSNAIITLPNAEGVFESFRVYENSVMDPSLAARYPEIKSYLAVGITNPGERVYFSLSPLGFKSMTLNPGKLAVFIEPVTADLTTYTVYRKSDYTTALSRLECSMINDAVSTIDNTTLTSRPNADDSTLRTFRLALSCTGEYTTYFGGTKAMALAGMNNTLTRCNGIFETDFGLRLVLIPTTDSVIYTSSATDPYSDATGMSNWNSQLQSTLTSVIGEANYDIGHLFGATGGGGNAGCIGCVCVNGSKGSGYTSPSNGVPVGDNFDIDYVAHEMGHQLGANHTFTYATEGTAAQMEPGSGSTIMSYAGITTKDIQRHSDPYFHAISIQQVTNNIKAKTCPTLTNTGNAIPVVNAGLDYTIPKGTPFVLTGSATDANNDVLTYDWEEMDLGTATTTTPTATATSGPAFRSYVPTISPKRYFPTMATVLTGSTTTAGTEVPWEVMPTVARTLNFRLTVRDNRAGGPSNNSDDVIVTVNGTAGPFTVNSPNTAVSYTGGTTQSITWNVAGTTANGVNCVNVDILLSTDGGLNFTTTLLSGTPNDGTENVVIPNLPGTTNRIMIKGSNHIFFDVSDTNFTIVSSIPDTTPPSVAVLTASGTATTTTNLSWSGATDNVAVTNYKVYQNGVLLGTTSTTSYAVTGLSALTTYSFYVVAIDAAGNVSASSNIVSITTQSVDSTAPSAPVVTASGTTTSSTNLSWTAATDNVGVTGYYVYQNGVFKASTSGTSFTATSLTAATTYTYYVVARDAAGNVSASSNIASITTLATADTTAPSATVLTASGTTTTTTNLSWTAATDNVGVTGYNIYKNGVLLSTTSALSYAVSSLSASTTYAFYVVAKDAAGNVSASSNVASVTTSAAPDTTAPTSPALTASGTTTTTTNLSWTSATDNVGVTGYNVYQNGVLKTTTTATSYAVSGLSASTTYTFYVVAKDAAGNISVASNVANVTTLSIDTTAPSSTVLSTSGTTSSSTNLSWTAATDNVGVTGYNIYQNGVLKTTTTALSYAVTGLSASTTYSFYIVAKDAAGNVSASSNVANVTTLPNLVSYCTSAGKISSREYIKRVQVGSIDNSSGDNGGYGNFTSIATNLAIGTTNNVSIIPAWTGTVYSEAYRVWIDFNQDGDFADSGEQVFNQSKTKSALVNGSITIPTTALPGTTRMRVSMKYNGAPSTCEAFTYGEVEDYTVTITASGRIEQENAPKLDFKLYPNPVKGDILYISSLENPATFRIFNMMGQELAKNSIEEDSIYVGNLKAGTYLIEVSDGTSTITKRFIKQ